MPSDAFGGEDCVCCLGLIWGFFFGLFVFLFGHAVWHAGSWFPDPGSLTRDQTHAPCSGSTES